MGASHGARRKKEARRRDKEEREGRKEGMKEK